MHNEPRQKLCELIAGYGISLCDDPRRCEALLRDLCGQHQGEVHVLVCALRERVADDLRASENGVPRSILLGRLSKRLQDNRHISVVAADWAVESWAIALGVIGPEAVLQPEKEPGARPKRKPRKRKAKRESAEREVEPKSLRPGEASRDPEMAISADTVLVAPGGQGQYETIGSALKKTRAGTRIKIRPGVYKESLVIKRPVELLADGARDSVVIEGGTGECIRSQADYAIIRNLTLICRSPRQKMHSAVNVTRGRLLIDGCCITSKSHAGVKVSGTKSDPTIRNCRVQDSKDCGIWFGSRASGKVEDCEIHHNEGAGIVVTKQARPVIRRCTFHGNSVGLSVTDKAGGAVAESEFRSNTKAGIAIKKGGNPVIETCKIHAEKVGVWVYWKGRGSVRGCKISGTFDVGIAVKSGGNTVVSASDISDNGNLGIRVEDHSDCAIEDCEMARNAVAAVEVTPGGSAALNRCRIHKGNGSGIWVRGGAGCVVKGSDIAGNTESGIWIAKGGKVRIVGGNVSDPVVRERKGGGIRKAMGIGVGIGAVIGIPVAMVSGPAGFGILLVCLLLGAVIGAVAGKTCGG